MVPANSWAEPRATSVQVRPLASRSTFESRGSAVQMPKRRGAPGCSSQQPGALPHRIEGASLFFLFSVFPVASHQDCTILSVTSADPGVDGTQSLDAAATHASLGGKSFVDSCYHRGQR